MGLTVSMSVVSSSGTFMSRTSSSVGVVVLGVETLFVLEGRSLPFCPSTSSVGVGDPKGMMVWLTNSGATGLLCLVVVWGTRMT